MAGRMGDENVCVTHLKVVRIDLEKRLLLVHGSVPGLKNKMELIKGIESHGSSY
jgi:large subunit ribosomal protein L3